MLFLILLFLAVLSIALTAARRDEESLLTLLLSASLIVLLVGVIIYTAKTGGLDNSQKTFLFLSTKIQRWLMFLPFPLTRLGYIIAIGRYLFPPLLLLTACCYTQLPVVRRSRGKFWMIFILPAISLIIYQPSVFHALVRNRFALQRAILAAMVVWIVAYLLLAAYLLLQEYCATTILYCKRQFRYILITLLVVTMLYMLFGFQDPIQVYQLYTAEYLWFNGMSYANPSLSLPQWALLTVVCLILLVVGFWNLRNYNRMNLLENNEDVTLARKIDAATTGASVFVHSIKNQLLSTRVVHKKLQQEFAAEAPRLEKLQEYTELLQEMNDTMLQRMDDLYHSVKSNYISLVPVTADEIAQHSVTRFLQKYPEGRISVELMTHAPILADTTHLCEALYNLLTNAWDATLEQPNGLVELVVHSERMYIVFEVRDNGSGISRQEQKKIFDPFYTSKNTNYNWGMGLHYVRQIVKSHLGLLRLETEVGHGTSFFVMLPRYAPRHATGYYKGPKEEKTDDTSADSGGL